MKQLLLIDKLLYSFLLIIGLATLFFGFTNATYFDNVFAQEDGFIEYMTFLFLFLVSITQFSRLRKFKNKSTLWVVSVFFLGLLFFFGAGEEISWGQRIFNIESGDFFKDNNLQNETNLHNLEVGGIKLNKLIFTQLLGVVMGIYLLIIPLLYNKWDWLKRTVNLFAIPVPKLHQIIVFIVTSLIIVVLPNLSRKPEVHELFFACIFFLIFLNPKNKEEVYS